MGVPASCWYLLRVVTLVIAVHVVAVSARATARKDSTGEVPGADDVMYRWRPSTEDDGTGAEDAGLPERSARSSGIRHLRSRRLHRDFREALRHRAVSDHAVMHMATTTSAPTASGLIVIDDNFRSEVIDDQSLTFELSSRERVDDEEEGLAQSASARSVGAPNLLNKFRALDDFRLNESTDTDYPADDPSAGSETGQHFNETGSDDAGSELAGVPEESSTGAGLQMDIVTKFLRIVESQSLLGVNCTAGTEMNLGEGVVDRYAQERFRLEAEVAVNRANFMTRLWKYARSAVLQSEYILYASVRSIVEFDDDIFAGGNCYDKYAYKDYLLFCPFAYRTVEGPVLVKNLAVEYKYLTNTSEWFYRARKSAERVVRNYTSFLRGYTSYSPNGTIHGPLEDDIILSVSYEDGKWSKPYFDCGGGNIWMLTYTVPFFGYDNGTYAFKGTSGIDIDLRRVDIDQCPQRGGSTELNIFAASDKCKQETTKCVLIPGLGFRRGSYKCVCKDGFYFPVIGAEHRYYNGTFVEQEYEKLVMGRDSLYDDYGAFECAQCAEGCEVCEDDRPCVAALNWVLRTTILVLSSVISAALPFVAWFTWKYGNLKVVRAASPVLLRIIIIGAFFAYSTIIVMYPRPNVITCTLRVWLREMGFSLSYGALMLKTWRISVIFRVRSAKAVKITDLDLIKRLGFIVGGFAVFLAIRTVVATPHVIVARTADDLKAFLCSTDWWDHSCTVLEMVFLVWGISLCIVVRKAPSEFNESKFISMAIYNEFLLSVFLNISMIFLQSPANPDLLYIIFFCHSQLTITLLLCLIFGSKAYMVLKGQGKDEESSMLSKPSTTKFVPRPKSQNSTTQAASNRTPTDSSATRFGESDVQEEFKRLYMQLEILKEKNVRLGNRHLASKIRAMQEAANKEDANDSSATANNRQSIEGATVRQVLRFAGDEQNEAVSATKANNHQPEEVRTNGVAGAITTTPPGGEAPRTSASASPSGSERSQQPPDGDTIVPDESPTQPQSSSPGASVIRLCDASTDDARSARSLSIRGANGDDADSGAGSGALSAQSSPETRGGSAKRRRHRRQRIVINLDDKSRFTDEITV